MLLIKVVQHPLFLLAGGHGCCTFFNLIPSSERYWIKNLVFVRSQWIQTSCFTLRCNKQKKNLQFSFIFRKDFDSSKYSRGFFGRSDTRTDSFSAYSLFSMKKRLGNKVWIWPGIRCVQFHLGFVCNEWTWDVWRSGSAGVSRGSRRRFRRSS